MSRFQGEHVLINEVKKLETRTCDAAFPFNLNNSVTVLGLSLLSSVSSQFSTLESQFSNVLSRGKLNV